MAKRSAEDIGIEDGEQAYLKRQKIISTSTSTVESVQAATEINSGKQLGKLLAFDQDNIRAKHAIQSFKNFLDGFAGPDKDIGRETAILRDYLDAQKPEEENPNIVTCLPDLMQTWSYAAQCNDESLLSAVPSVLALLLKTLSHSLEFSEHGARLCRTILQKSQLELVTRGLTSNKNREYLISPALRLLKEVGTFDGGALAKQVFRARDYTFRSLVRNLNLRFSGDGIEDVRRPSVRTNALRFILPILKFLPTEAKRDLFTQRDIASALTRGIENDPAPMVRDILTTLKTHVLQDGALPRDAKTKVINATSLGQIALLYGYEHPDEWTGSYKKPVNLVAHEFLVLACTSHENGVLNHQTGFYPRGIDPDDLAEVGTDDAVLDLGLDSIEWLDRFTDQVPVRNMILSEFIQTLRPWSSSKQRELLIAVFGVAPELVAEFFFNKRTFSFDPKLTATWIGYSAFLFSNLQLPIPKFFGYNQRYARLPPPHSIVLENILPQPLSQKVLRGCLLQPEPLIKFFAVRLLCLALTKFKDTLRMYHEAAEGSTLWMQAAVSLTDAFCKICPSIKDVIHGFRNMSDNDLLQREAITKLLVLYYEVVPRIALEAKFDVSGVLSQTLHNMENAPLKPEDRALRAMELENLFQFAHFSPGMRWFATAPEAPLSPFMAMLKLSAEAPADVPLLRLNSVLASVVKENQILQTQTKISALDAFILRLRSLGSTSNAAAIYTFLGDCISRCAAKPIKYIYALEEMEAGMEESQDQQRPCSLLTLVIMEQWPFMIKSTDDKTSEEIAQFVAVYLATCIKIKENKEAIKSVQKRLISETPVESSARKPIERFRKITDNLTIPEAKQRSAEGSTTNAKNITPSDAEKTALAEAILVDPTPHTEDHRSLVKWSTKEVDEVVEGGHAASLIMLLSSEHLSIRKEALTAVSKFSAKLKDSSFEEKEQIWLLLSEVAETAKKVIDQEPVPTVITAFAAHAVPVLTDPLHILYPKINKFLSQGPTWELEKIPLMYKILDEAPSRDDAHYPEMSWLLTYLLAALRTTADMDIYRKRRAFEKLLSIWNSAYLAPGLRDKILRILFRATMIEGGSSTLITRFSTMTWLQAQVALGSGMSLKVLMERILATSDQQRIKKWSRVRGVDTIKGDTLNF